MLILGGWHVLITIMIKNNSEDAVQPSEFQTNPSVFIQKPKKQSRSLWGIRRCLSVSISWKCGAVSQTYSLPPRRDEHAQIVLEEVMPNHRVRLEEGVALGSCSLTHSGGWSQTTGIWCLRPVLLAFRNPSAGSQQRRQHWLVQSIQPAIATVAFLWYTLLCKYTNYLEVLYSRNKIFNGFFLKEKKQICFQFFCCYSPQRWKYSTHRHTHTSTLTYMHTAQSGSLEEVR